MKFFLTYLWQKSSTSEETIPHKEALKATTLDEALKEGKEKAEAEVIGHTFDIGFPHSFAICAEKIICAEIEFKGEEGTLKEGKDLKDLRERYVSAILMDD